MRYLANKKHQAHINAFLKIFVSLFTIITFAAFGESPFLQHLNEYRWQMLLLLSVAFIYAIFRRFYLYIILLFILLTINFFVISSVAVFYNPRNDSATNVLFVPKIVDSFKLFDGILQQKPDIVAVSKIDTSYFSKKEAIPEQYQFIHSSDINSSGFMLSKIKVLSSGRVNLGKENYAYFIKAEVNSLVTNFIAVDFSSLNFLQIKNALNNLSVFVANLDDPIVIFGDFNTVAWSNSLSSFIFRHNLIVKNGLYDNLRNFIIPEHYYILAYEKGEISGTIMFSRLNSFPLFTRF